MDNGSTWTDALAMPTPGLVAAAWLQAELERPRQLLISTAIHFGHFTLTWR